MKKIRRKFANCKRRVGEDVVQNGLAVTPSDVLRMAEKGIPASAQMNASFIDGTPNPGWDVPLEERRGIDIGQMWQFSKDAKQKFRDAHARGEVVNAKTE